MNRIRKNFGARLCYSLEYVIFTCETCTYQTMRVFFNEKTKDQSYVRTRGIVTCLCNIINFIGSLVKYLLYPVKKKNRKLHRLENKDLILEY